MSSELASLVQRRGRLKGSLTRHSQFRADISDATSLVSLLNRLDKLESTWKEFAEVDDMIAALPDQVSEYGEYEDMYFGTREAYDVAISRRKEATNHSDKLNATMTQFVE